MELCPALGIVIPVGKDSMSMKTRWSEAVRRARSDRADVADRLGIRAGDGCAPDGDAADRSADETDTLLVLLDLGRGATDSGARHWRRSFNQVGDSVPDIDDAR
jgi:phosphoribosylformylglycinamidine synthase